MLGETIAQGFPAVIRWNNSTVWKLWWYLYCLSKISYILLTFASVMAGNHRLNHNGYVTNDTYLLRLYISSAAGTLKTGLKLSFQRYIVIWPGRSAVQRRKVKICSCPSNVSKCSLDTSPCINQIHFKIHSQPLWLSVVMSLLG